MKFVLFLCLASAAALGVLAAKLETEESQYYFSAPNQGDDRSSETETKTDNEDGSEMIEEDDVKPPTPVKIQPKKKKKTTCTCPKTTAETTPTEPTMTWEALEELLDDIRDIGPVSGTPVPVYRMDLADDYVAYWSFELNSTEYVVISSGSATGDNKLVVQGPLPSMISQLDITADGYTKSCSRYYMMTPDGDMLCKDEAGKIVATTAEMNIVTAGKEMANVDDPNFERAHANLMNNTCDLRVEFVKRMMEVKSKRIWNDEELTDAKDREDSPTSKRDDDDDEDNGFIENDITPGGIIRLPVNKHTKSIRAMYVRQKNEEKSAYARSMQKKLCRVLSLCDLVSSVNIDITKTQHLYGYSYIELKISEDARALLNATSIDFELQTEFDNKQLMRKRFSVHSAAKRQKRRTANIKQLFHKKYGPWGSWRYTSIDHESYFPDYQQHVIKGIYGEWCYAGSGAVAWAMIFGFYDRNAHYKKSGFGNATRSLYRCGYDGTFGSDACVAPKYVSSTRTQRYIKTLSRILGSRCKDYSGLTPRASMWRAQLYFEHCYTADQSANPRILSVAKGNIAGRARAWLSSGWPVLVDICHDHVFGNQYAVMTRYRRKSRRVWICTGYSCFRRRQNQFIYQMYIHRGFGLHSTLWKPMRICYAAYARF